MITRSDHTSPPGWTGERTAPRILVEDADRDEAESFARVIDGLGWDAAICPGPNKLLHGCPLLNEGSCPAVDAADVVVFGLSLGEVRNRSVLWTHRPTRSARPVVVDTTGPLAAQHQNVLDTLPVCEQPVTSQTLARTVSDAIERRRGYLSRDAVR